MGYTISWGAVGLPRGALRDKEATGGAGGGPLQERYSFIYDWSDFTPDIGKIVSLL